MVEYKEFVLVGVGLPRTGTLSTKLALEMILPGKCYHMVDALSFQDEWVKILRNDTTDDEFASHFTSNGYVAAVDFPFSICYEQALRAFPNAKVLLNVRDPVRWVESMNGTIIISRKIQNQFPCSMFKWLGIGSTYLMWSKFTSANQMNKPLEAIGKGTGVEYFNNWNHDKSLIIPKDKLLIFNVKEGWKPLCEFLGVPIPEKPFPNVNDTAAFKSRLSLKQRRAWLLVYELITLPALLYGFYSLVRKH